MSSVRTYSQSAPAHTSAETARRCGTYRIAVELMTRWISIVGSIARAGLLAAAGSFAFALLANLNVRVTPNLPWAAPVILILGLLLLWVFGQSHLKVGATVESLRFVFVAATLGLVLGALALGLSWLASGRTGIVLLPGDRLIAPTYFQNSMSLAMLSAAAVVEETAVRAQLQFRVRALVGVGLAELAAGVVFIALHFGRLGNWEEVVFLTLLSFAAGRVASWSSSIVGPISVHLGANLVLVGGVLLARG